MASCLVRAGGRAGTGWGFWWGGVAGSSLLGSWPAPVPLPAPPGDPGGLVVGASESPPLAPSVVDPFYEHTLEHLAQGVIQKHRGTGQVKITLVGPDYRSLQL